MLVLGAAVPARIVVRNDSPRDLTRVSLVEAGKSAARARRVGSLAPVPRGVDQEVARSASAKPLPRRVEIRWTDREGFEFSETVDLKATLAAATGAPGERLVVRIGPSNELQVVIESDPASSGAVRR